MRVVIQLRAEAADRDCGGVLQDGAVGHEITRRGELVAAGRLAKLRRAFGQSGAEERQEGAVPIHQPAHPGSVVAVKAGAEAAEVRAVESGRLLAAHGGTGKMAEHWGSKMESAGDKINPAQDEIKIPSGK